MSEHSTTETKPVRPTSSDSSAKDSESFQDATENSPRLDSHSDSQSDSESDSGSEDSQSQAPDSRRGSSVPAKTNMPAPAPAASGAPAAPNQASDGAEKPQGEPESSSEESSEDEAPVKSPLLTSHRISMTSDMDDVSLEEGAGTSGPAPTLPPRDSRDSTAAVQGLSGSISPVKFPPPPPPPTAPSANLGKPVPPTMSRKLTSPFAWLSRNSSNKKSESSPAVPPSERRNTNASIATLNADHTLSRIEDEDQHPSNRSSQGSLRDRFKFLRMREEAGITLGDETSLEAAHGRSASVGLGLVSTGSVPEDEHHPGPASPPPGSLAKQPTINPNLAPGTAAGFAAGPAGDAAEPVDWDLWQSVVNEGPAAIARTSAEELNHAISNGIPQVIRGVIWQVLAQSKNEGLESMYRELVARGTDKEVTTARVSTISNGNGKEKDSVASSSSSIHSDCSTPATTTGSTNAPLPSPSIKSETSEEAIKSQAKLAADKKHNAAEVSKLEKTIKRDLGARTSYSKYLMAAGLQDGLFGICKAYALYDEDVGYAQGMNFIAMPLLFNMPEEEAFSLFVTLMNKYGLRDLFVHDMAGLHLHLYQFERLLEEFEPALYCHLRRREVKPQLYATQWFLTLFAYRFPLQLVLRIYDLILSEGLESAILKFGIVLMQKNAEALLGMKDMTTLTTFLKERLFDAYIDKAPSANSIRENGFFGSTAGVDKEVYRADMLVKDAVAVKITSEMLKQYATEWKEQQRVEKERETELSGLRDKVAKFEAKVRLLEGRAEQSDMEHVQVASELIKTKVENENLAEENESLKINVAELQKIVNSQPEEIEAKLQGEMESVMQKNIVVHNENRALEEQMAEMEQELVATKMQWATINEEHETLKQKWNSVSQMMKK
ncbi:RabGAP/TBC [Dothidotthia symphoricarpi CBS 119687]|uniref:GTPase-activating protein GYP5 n=1 Tax=Dothidotthia symphoricarpi CBS 119687 TaxID=1392245 RepID=A0A6A6AIJ8_9PLEO|nr:RabGAP/TBC [Dothidotthia symphoricarpi CBS 119687]KAF2130908.1 RabGAP/TBC [Dothidotthia symphoricarpi CBS 119687]